MTAMVTALFQAVLLQETTAMTMTLPRPQTALFLLEEAEAVQEVVEAEEVEALAFSLFATRIGNAAIGQPVQMAFNQENVIL